jgi:FMN phosphatase YigB (HAD superfamily)
VSSPQDGADAAHVARRAALRAARHFRPGGAQLAAGMFSAVLLDVGGTLWPDRLDEHLSSDPCLVQLRQLLPMLDPVDVLARLRAALERDNTRLVQDTHARLAGVLRTLGGTAADLDPDLVRGAMCTPAVPGVALFPGAAELLMSIKSSGLACVIVSNVQVRGAADYWRDFSDYGLAQSIHAVVTSLEVGFRKPHPAVFEAALRAAECDPRAGVMIGNSERNDIEPAVALGLRAIRVAIEEPRPTTTAAHAVCENLAEVREILHEWMRGADGQ